MSQWLFARIIQRDLPVIVVRSTAGRLVYYCLSMHLAHSQGYAWCSVGQVFETNRCHIHPKNNNTQYCHGASYICVPKIYQAALNAPVVVVAVESPTGPAAIYWSSFIVFWDDTGGCWSVSIARLSPGMCCYIATIPPILEIWCHIQFCC